MKYSCQLSVILTFLHIGPCYCSNTTDNSPKLQQVESVQETMDKSNVISSNSTEDGLHTETCPDPMQEYVSPVHGNPKCCRKCGKGTGMLRLCTDSEDTQCTACEPGSEFSPFPSATMKCRQCRRCQDLHPFSTTRTKCTPITDTECGCISGFYMSVQQQICHRCAVCGMNEGVVRPCLWNVDTQCEPCPNGFWAAQIGNTVKCLPCSSCSDDQVMVRQCEPNADSLCCPKSKVNCTSNSQLYDIGSPFGLPNSDTTTHTIQQNQMLPIYCSIMGLIIVFLSIYVIYKLWKQREALKNTKLSDVESMMSIVNGTGKGSDRSISSRRRWPSAAAYIQQNSNRIDQSQKSSPSNTISQYSPLDSFGQETLPLLGGSTDCDSAARKLQLKDCPVDILGVLCCQCSKVDLEKLINTLDVKMDNIAELEWTTLHESLFQLALKYNQVHSVEQTATAATEIEKLRKCCRLIIYLCAQHSNQPTYGTIFDLLRSMQESKTTINYFKEDSNTVDQLTEHIV